MLTIDSCSSADVDRLLGLAGKSQIVGQVAADLNYNFLDVRAVQLDPVDLRGLPRIASDQTEWVPPKFLPTTGEGKVDRKSMVLFYLMSRELRKKTYEGHPWLIQNERGQCLEVFLSTDEDSVARIASSEP